MSELQFPKDPIVGQEYDFPPYRYYWDGIKWKTMGIGYNPVNDLRDEVLPTAREAIRRSYAEAGYPVKGVFVVGAQVTSATDVLIDKATGIGYAFTGAYPHTVATGETPASAGWASCSTEELRTQLLAGAVAVRNGILSLRDLVSVKDFGAVGNGVVDDTLAFTMWLAYLLSTGAKGFIPEGKYLTHTLTANNGTKGLHIEAPGWHATEIIRHPESTDGAVIRISYTPGVYLSGFKTNAQHDATGNATTGIILKDCPNSILYRVWSHNTGILGILAHHPNDVAAGDDLSYMVRGVHFIKCRSSDTVGGGIQMVGCSESGMEGCLAERAGTTGIYFKCPIRLCYSSNNQTVDALTGTSLGTDYGTEQTGEQLTITNFRAKDVLTTARFNCMRNSEITNITGYQTGDNTDGFGDGIRLENSFDNSFNNVNIKNVAPSRAAARFTSGSARNEVQLSNALLLAGAFNSRFETGTSNNLVKASKLIGAPTVRRSQDVDNANTHLEEFVISAVFNGQLSVNATHNLKYDTIPLHRLTFWFSAPPPSAPAVAMVSENSISITFTSPYTGTVKLSLQ